MNNRIGLSSTVLKVIAVVTMIIDHIGAILLGDVIVLRIIGRIAFPIFAYLICEGYEHTSNLRAYIIRLGAFALISEPFFDYAIYGRFGMINLNHQNVFFTLFIAVVTIYFCENQGTWIWSMMGMVVADLLNTDYGALGVMLILMLWYQRKEKWQLITSVSTFAVAFCLFEIISGWGGGISVEILKSLLLQMWCLLSIPFILMYNGKRGGEGINKNLLKYSFYVVYPLQFFILASIKYIL